VSAVFSRRSALAALSGAVSVIAVGPTHASTPVLRVGDQKGGVESMLRASGELENPPYRIEFVQFPAAAPVLEALNAGAVDVAWAGDAPTTFALANGTPAHIVSAHRSNGAGTALLVKPDSPIRTAADLKGRHIGTNRGSIGYALVISALRANGLPFDAVQFAYLLPADAKFALRSGAVDVWATWGVYVAQALLVDHSREILDGSNGLMSGLGYLSALDTAITDKRAAVGDLVARAARASRWAATHTDDYARYWSGLVGVSFDVAQLSLKTSPATAVRIDAGVIADQQRTADLYTDGGLIARHIDVHGYFDASFNDAVNA
jgi:sulfonate transport system substrate-binding protein